MGKLLVVVGLLIAFGGLLLMLGVPIGRLPGDITYRRGNTTFYFPIVTSILASVLLTLLLALFCATEAHWRSKADRWIKKMALEHGMIEPFEDRQCRSGVVSWPVVVRYDIRVADEFKVFTNINNTVIDPKQFDPRSFVDLKTDICIVHELDSRSPGRSEMATSPRCAHGLSRQVDLRAVRDRQSTAWMNTVRKPAWRFPTRVRCSAKIYANEGIAQVLFFRATSRARSYGDKKGSI